MKITHAEVKAVMVANKQDAKGTFDKGVEQLTKNLANGKSYAEEINKLKKVLTVVKELEKDLFTILTNEKEFRVSNTLTEVEKEISISVANQIVAGVTEDALAHSLLKELSESSSRIRQGLEFINTRTDDLTIEQSIYLVGFLTAIKKL